MRRYLSRCLWLLLVLLAAGCGSSAGKGTAVQYHARPGMAGAPGLPAPAVIIADAAPPRAGSEAVLVLAGKDFDPAAAQRVTVQGTDALFAPNWRGRTTPSSGLAYAVYWFQPQGLAGAHTVQLTWSTPPDELEHLWVGLSNWDAQRWDWQRGSDSGVVLAPGGLERYTQNGSGYLLVAVMLLGDQPCSLSAVRVGVSLAGGWRMFGHDAQHTHRSEFVSSQTGRLLWQTQNPLGGPAYGVVFDRHNRSYVCCAAGITGGEPAAIVACDPDGSVAWTHMASSWTYCTPAVGHDGDIYFGDWTGLTALSQDGQPRWQFSDGGGYFLDLTLDERDNIFALDSTHGSSMLASVSHFGELRWKTYVTGEGFICGPALAADGTAYAAGVPGVFAALSQQGELQWYYGIDCTVKSSPAVMPDGTVVIGARSQTNDLLALNPDGTLRWIAHTQGYIRSSPALGADGAVYINCDDGLLYAFSSAGEQLWTAPAGGYSSIAIGADGVIYAGGMDCRLYAYSHDGALLWRSEPAGGEFINPAISDSGTLVVCCEDGWVRAYGE